MGKCRLNSKYNDNLEEVREICTKKSNEMSNITFHLREGLYSHAQSNGSVVYLGRRSNYIEVIVGDATGAPDMEAGLAGFPSLTNNVGLTSIPAVTVNSGEKRLAQRLQELEGIRSLITEKDYEQKKKEILDDI